MMRRVVGRRPTATTWYCQWGMPYAKPTDVWTNITGAWPACRNGAPDHDYQPRSYGAKVAAGVLLSGTQGRPNREAIRTRLEAGERVAGWGLRSDGTLRKRTAIEMLTGGRKSTNRSTTSRWARDAAITTRGARGAAERALIPPAMAHAVMLACLTDGPIE